MVFDADVAGDIRSVTMLPIRGSRLAARSTRRRHLLSESRADILARLQSCPVGTTIRTLVDEFGLHENTVREHLAGLIELGLARRRLSDPQGPGRPAWIYYAE